MTALPPQNVPGDLYMLLGKIEAGQQSTRDEIKAAREDIREMEKRLNARADDHDDRLKAVEIELGDRASWKKRVEAAEAKGDEQDDRLLRIETTASNIKTGVQVLWAVFGAALLALGAKLLGLFH